jgi:hypothetical protein
MSYYRNTYLKSDHWQNLRLEKLAHSNTRCCICHAASISNDVHHISYGKSLFEVGASDLRVVCRTCHEDVHEAIELNPSLMLLTPQQRWAEAQRIVIYDRKSESKFPIPADFRTFFAWAFSGGKTKIIIAVAMRLRAIYNYRHSKLAENSENIKKQKAERLTRDGVKNGSERNWLASYLRISASEIKLHPDYKANKFCPPPTAKDGNSWTAPIGGWQLKLVTQVTGPSPSEPTDTWTAPHGGGRNFGEGV